MIKLFFQLLIIFILSHLRWVRVKNVKIICYSIKFEDLKALLYETYYIFKNGIYYFKSQNNAPFIIDGGSHIGTSVIYFKDIYPNAEILAFEPDEKIRGILKSNLTNNKVKGVDVEPVGLSNYDGRSRFNPDSSNGGRIESGGTKIIEIRRLSPYIQKSVDFLKLNIEGEEAAVISELANSGKIWLVKEMVIEWHSFKKNGQNLSKLLKVLEENGFKYLISNFPGAPRGKFYLDETSQFFILIYAKRMDKKEKSFI